MLAFLARHVLTAAVLLCHITALRARFRATGAHEIFARPLLGPAAPALRLLCEIGHLGRLPVYRTSRRHCCAG